MKSFTCDHCQAVTDARNVAPNKQPPIKQVNIEGFDSNKTLILDLCETCRPLFKAFVETFIKK
jgi:hypothetical protein